MPLITFPDGRNKKYQSGVTGIEIAGDISESLKKKAVAILVDNQQKDLTDPIEEDSKVSIITLNDNDGLEIMRHTLTAQVLARAIKNLYPGAKLAIGPTIDDGFYYDIETEDAISIDDLEKIEDEMIKIVKTKSSITKKLVGKEDALKIFKSQSVVFCIHCFS